MATDDVIPFRDTQFRDTQARDPFARSREAPRPGDAASDPASREARAARLARTLAEQPPVTLRDQLLRLKRRRWLILGTVLLGTLLALVAVEGMTVRYTATATVMLEPREQRTLDVEAVVSGLPPDVETIQGEIAIIQSRGLAEKVIAELALDRMPEFNPQLAALEPRGFDPLGRLADLVRDGVGWAGDTVQRLAGEPPRPSAPLSPAELETRIVNAVLARLEARPRGRSRVIEIAFTSRDRQLAPLVANTFAERYIDEQLEAKYEATRRATEWLNTRLADLRLRTEAAERTVEEFRAEAGLIQGETTTLAAQELSRLNAELIVLRGARSEAEARLRAAEAAQGATSAASLPMAVLQNPLIQTLQGQQIDLNRRLAEAGETFGPRHPTIVNLRAEMKDLQGRIGQEVEKIVAGLRNEVAIARQREETLATELSRLTTAAGGRGPAAVQLRSLEEEAAANRLLLNTLMARANETTLQQDLQQADARVISAAPLPQQPSEPRGTLIVALAFLVSAGTGVALAYLVEMLDAGFRSAEQVGAATGLPALGLVPVLKRSWFGRRIPPHDMVLRKPRSAFAEAISGAVTALMLSGSRRPRTLMVTSALPNEGKSTVSVALARAATRAGLRTLLIDGDLRRPSIHMLVGLPLQPGLSDYLTDGLALEEVVQRDPKSGTDVLAAGTAHGNPATLLAGEAMRGLMAGLSRHYDLVVVDSAPVMVVTDPRVLGRQVDETLFVVRWTRTRREHALHGLKQVLEAGGSVAGVLLTMVDTRRHADYSFADSGQYHLGTKYYQR